VKEPENQGLTKDLPAIYDLIALALQTDSTRVATLEIGGSFAAGIFRSPRCHLGRVWSTENRRSGSATGST